MSSTRASKRSAAEAQLPNTEAVVVAPAATVVPMSDASSAELLAAGGPAPQPQIEGFTAPVPTVAEETTGHKAKRVATETAHTVQTAVTAGLETASAAFNNAVATTKEWSDRELVRTGHSNAPGVTALNSELPVEPTLRDKTHNTLNSVQFGIERAAEATLAGAKVAAAKIAEGIHTLGEKIEPHAATISAKSVDLTEKALAQGNVALEKSKIAGAAALEKTKVAGSAALEKSKVAGSAALEKSKAAIAHATASSGDKQVSDDSHLREKKDGSLPVERNADEFPHAKAVTFEADSRIHNPASGMAPGQSGLGTDKVVDAPVAKSDAQVDLLTGDARPLQV